MEEIESKEGLKVVEFQNPVGPKVRNGQLDHMILAHPFIGSVNPLVKYIVSGPWIFGTAYTGYDGKKKQPLNMTHNPYNVAVRGIPVFNVEIIDPSFKITVKTTLMNVRDHGWGGDGVASYIINLISREGDAKEVYKLRIAPLIKANRGKGEPLDIEIQDVIIEDLQGGEILTISLLCGNSGCSLGIEKFTVTIIDGWGKQISNFESAYIQSLAGSTYIPAANMADYTDRKFGVEDSKVHLMIKMHRDGKGTFRIWWAVFRDFFTCLVLTILGVVVFTLVTGASAYLVIAFLIESLLGDEYASIMSLYSDRVQRKCHTVLLGVQHGVVSIRRVTYQPTVSYLDTLEEVYGISMIKPIRREVWIYSNLIFTLKISSVIGEFLFDVLQDPGDFYSGNLLSLEFSSTMAAAPLLIVFLGCIVLTFKVVRDVKSSIDNVPDIGLIQVPTDILNCDSDSTSKDLGDLQWRPDLLLPAGINVDDSTTPFVAPDSYICERALLRNCMISLRLLSNVSVALILKKATTCLSLLDHTAPRTSITKLRDFDVCDGFQNSKIWIMPDGADIQEKMSLMYMLKVIRTERFWLKTRKVCKARWGNKYTYEPDYIHWNSIVKAMLMPRSLGWGKYSEEELFWLMRMGDLQSHMLTLRESELKTFITLFHTYIGIAPGNKPNWFLKLPPGQTKGNNWFLKRIHMKTLQELVDDEELHNTMKTFAILLPPIVEERLGCVYKMLQLSCPDPFCQTIQSRLTGAEGLLVSVPIGHDLEKIFTSKLSFQISYNEDGLLLMEGKSGNASTSTVIGRDKDGCPYILVDGYVIIHQITTGRCRILWCQEGDNIDMIAQMAGISRSLAMFYYVVAGFKMNGTVYPPKDSRFLQTPYIPDDVSDYLDSAGESFLCLNISEVSEQHNFGFSILFFNFGVTFNGVLELDEIKKNDKTNEPLKKLFENLTFWQIYHIVNSYAGTASRMATDVREHHAFIDKILIVSELEGTITKGGASSSLLKEVRAIIANSNLPSIRVRFHEVDD